MRKFQRLRNFSIGKVGLNINGDLSKAEIEERVRIAEGAGIRVIWIGEFEGFEDPFSVAETVSSCSSVKVGFGVLSAQKDCERIIAEVEELRKRYGDRFIVGIGAGSYKTPKEGYRRLIECLNLLKDAEFPVVVGAGSPMTASLSKKVDGVLFNSVKEEFVSWLLSFTETAFKAAYGPALILPSSNEEDLLLAAAIVFTGSKKLIEEFGFEEVARDLSKVDIMSMIRARWEGRSIADEKGAEILLKHKEFLLQNFTISGSAEDLKERIKSLLNLCDHVVLADPLFRDVEAVRRLKEVVV
jgi:5,10-methylenetetrahydromethanopterin reductase